MRKIFLVTMFIVGLLIGAGIASAHDVWQVDSLGNFVLDSFGNKIAVIHNHPTNQNPLNAFQPFFGLTGHEIVARGWTLKPGEGDCPIWYPRTGCWTKK